jgi:hypothetical protein
MEAEMKTNQMERLEAKLDGCKTEAWLEEFKATDLEANQEIEIVESLRKPVMKRSKWIVLEHWRTDKGADI